MTDVAAAAGVSRSTVSLAFSGRRPIRSATRQRIFKVTQALNYRPNRAAQTLRAGRTAAIGLLLHDMHDQWAGVLVEQIKACAAEMGYRLALWFDSPSVRPFASGHVHGLCDGIILHSGPLSEVFLDLARQGYPVGELFPSGISEHVVAGAALSEEAAYQRAVELLLQLGHREFGLVWLGKDNALDRLVQTLERQGCKVPPHRIITGARRREEGEQLTLQLLDRCPEITALCCYNDMVAIGATLAAARLSRRVPADLSVIGHGDTEWGAIWSPALTTIQYPVAMLCRETVCRLVSRIEGKPLSPPARAQANLIVRASTGPAPGQR